MDPLSVTASIIAVLQLSAKVLEYLNNVKDAPKDRTQCAVEMLNLCSLLYKLRDHVEQSDPTQPWCFAIHDLAAKNGPLDQFKRALETLQTKIGAGNRSNKASEALMWKFKKEEISSTLGRIERLKSLIELALQMDHFKLSRAIKDDITPVRVHVDDTEHRNLLEWISPTEYPTQQSDIIKIRQEGTGKWFLDAPEVAEWRSDTKATLFCPGIPGAGKTMVAAIAIDSLLKSIEDTSVRVAYVYCNYKDQKEQDVTSILAAILKQLVQGRPPLTEPLTRLHKQHTDKGTRPSADELSIALQSVILDLSTVYIVIDALDECRNNDGTRRGLLARIRDLQSKADVRFLATSRFLPDIVDEFKDSRRLEVRASDEDVRRFVAGQVHRLPNCIQRKHELQMLVQDKIAESVNGMFLLARLHTDSLLDKRTPKEIKATLTRLSKGSAALDDAYEDAIRRIEGQLAGDFDRAKNVLSWITYAQRPLTTAEICCALAVEIGEEELDPENLPDVEDLVSVCAGLVVVDEESRVVRLVHYTTQEYLERIRETWNPRAQLEIASTCLTYLSFNDFKYGSCSTDAELEEQLQQNVFLDYAARYWGLHALPVEDDVGHQTVVQILLGKGAEVNTQGGDYGNALQAASSEGHEAVVKVLLEKGAEINTQGGRCGNALYAASRRGHEAVVKVLLEKGAKVKAQGGYYGNALQAASQGGHEAVVKVLLGKGAEINTQGGEFGNAL
ncbi:hypothetical protein K458DRAFT_297429 [Lentithecium fluviatile CBS 122367]|uniref:Uncharacterized protein n=1 Tax=Lentithecium fluviatile CBS 122367 TaxID=1168545 RepID=A0A6G1J803_9PLEO|nr:hypothetical protein K458DRAFT_297429 [Lentithecium fluviatile CBS 122367]